MNEPQTISKQLPALTSMQYETLREIGIQRIQELAGKLWTDYNTHDPGITILEVLSYVLTDIGYRINYDIKDILAQKLGAPDYYDIQNFYTACEILPVCPVTFNDFREIMIDVEIVDDSEEETQYYGVKNAWINKSPDAEHAIYVDEKNSKLSLSPIPDVVEQDKFYVKTLYDVLLEFDKNEKYGDLNENTIEGEFVLYEFPALVELQGLKIAVTIAFPNWDDPIDWTNFIEVRSAVQEVSLKFLEVADGYGFTYELTNDMRVILGLDADSEPVPLLNDLSILLNDYLYDPVDGLIVAYVEKVNIIHSIVDEVKKKLHQNRNLCDDFFRFNALKVEEILLCTDIELDNQADVEETEAAIFYAISNFLSPTVYFYTLEEMLNKCAIDNTYAIHAVRKGEKVITIAGRLWEDVGSEDTVSVTGDDTIAGEYTVVCIKENEQNPDNTDIYVEEELASEEFSEDAILFVGRIDENLCKTVDEIFEGPKLKHGFIDEAELEAAQLTKVIHVSDLIRIIMDIEGVKAVRNIQIANQPQDNDAGIPEKSVKWCLELAWEHNYVPRLNLTNSKITYYKEQLPFLANDVVVNELIEAMEATDRPQKIHYPKMDIDPPLGEFKDIENYVSLQEEFPDIYGVGSSGIPDLSPMNTDQKKERQGKVKQLKGFLTFFDQLIANELAQLNKVKDLFSMNGDKNEFGEYKIDHTYFAKDLSTVIPNGSDLYVDKAGHLVSLKKIVEDEALYIERRNKFLDHLLGRFAESFTDYAILAHKIDKDTAGLELIEDKLQFLSRYPEISAERGKGFNYLQDCYQWHIHNVSGVEQRSSFLTGIEEREILSLNFSSNFTIKPSLAGFVVSDDADNPLLVQNENLEDEAEVKELLERVVMTGLCRSSYEIVLEDSGKFSFRINCEGDILGVSEKNDYNSDADGGDADTAIQNLIDVFLREHFENHEANRKNLACPWANYFKYELTADITPVPPELPTYTFEYTLFSRAFRYTNTYRVLRGKITEEVVLEDTETLPLTEAQVLKKGEARIRRLLWEIVSSGIDRRQYILDGALSPYRFQLSNKKGVILGSSTDKDFNKLLADQMAASSSDQLQILESTANDGVYTLIGAVDQGPHIELQLNSNLPSAIFDGKAVWEDSFGIQEINTADRTLKATANISAHFVVDDVFEIRNSSSNDGFYTIRDIKNTGGKTVLSFWEPIPTDTADGTIIDQHIFEMVGISGDKVLVKGGEDEKAIQKLIDFLKAKFFNHEGMHLIEHTLLRPRINESLYVEMEPKQLVALGGTTAQLLFPKRTDIRNVNTGTNTILVEDNIKAEIEGDTIAIEEGPYHGTEWKVLNITNQSGRSKLRVRPKLRFNLPKPPFDNGRVRYSSLVEINKIKPTSNTVTIADATVKDMQEGDIVIIRNPGKVQNEGQYMVQSVKKVGPNYDVKLISKWQWVQDQLLPVYLDQECETCQLSDVYSCIATVILPYWADRFINIDFRKFMEKTIRLETPAHVLLNICWINCEQMETFEKTYKAWLLEINKPVWNKPKLSQALNEFIEALVASRNVYPTGTLHSCDEDESLESAIILNNSVLGI